MSIYFKTNEKIRLSKYLDMIKMSNKIDKEKVINIQKKMNYCKLIHFFVFLFLI